MFLLLAGAVRKLIEHIWWDKKPTSERFVHNLPTATNRDNVEDVENISGEHTDSDNSWDDKIEIIDGDGGSYCMGQ